MEMLMNLTQIGASINKHILACLMGGQHDFNQFGWQNFVDYINIRKENGLARRVGNFVGFTLHRNGIIATCAVMIMSVCCIPQLLAA